jgi:hypothetical protein
MGEYSRENKTEGEKEQLRGKRTAEGNRKKWVVWGKPKRAKTMQNISFKKSNIVLCKLVFTKWQV